MQIGAVIRKYRKEKNMTQEEMANRLGVSAPAVNKWENGNSMPDIMLLAPIARLLGISLDTLLSFRESLTEEEINNLVEGVNRRLKKGTYEEAFQYAKEKRELYPNCESLSLWMAEVLDAWRCFHEVHNSEYYDDYLCECYCHALGSTEEEIKSTAADMLFAFYLRKEQYEKAENYLNYFSIENPERKRKQAVIYSKTGRNKEAYQLYEEVLFSGYQTLNAVFHSIYMLLMEEKNIEKARFIVEKEIDLARLFEMGEYYAISPRLDLAVMEKDVDMTLDIMEKMLRSVEKIGDFCKSPLYEHMTLTSPKEETIDELKRNLLEAFKDEETFDYLKDNERWTEFS